MLGERDDGSLIEIESRDVDFIENEFSSRGEVDRSSELQEISDEVTPSRQVEDEEEIHPAPKDIRSNLTPSGSIPLVEHSQISQPRRKSRESLPRRHFEIEGEALIVTPQDDEQPKNLKEVISYPAKEEWLKTMKDEMESMKTNQVWDLVGLPTGRRAIGSKWVLKLKL